MCLTRRVSRRSLADGLGTNDFRARALVLLAGGATAFAAALVFPVYAGPVPWAVG